MSQHRRERNLELQRYFDGEVTPEERAQIERSLTPEDTARLSAMAEIRTAVVSALEAEAEGADLWGGIAARLDAPITDLDRARETKKAAGPDRRRSRILGRYAVAVAAVAAAAMILLRPAGRGLVTDDCDVEQLEVEGAMASVFKLDGDDGVTVIWTEEIPEGAAGEDPAAPGSPVEMEEEEEDL